MSSSSLSRFWLQTVLGPMLAGLVYSGAFAPLSLWPLVFVGLTWLLCCLRGLTAYEARRAGFLFGLVVTCIGCLWLKNIFGWTFLLLCAFQSLFWGVFGWGHAIIDRQPWNGWRKMLAVACAWTGIEFIRAEHFWLDFPWLTPGHGLGVIQLVTQPLLSWVGVYGVGFVVICVCWWLRPVMAGLGRAVRWQVEGRRGLSLGGLVVAAMTMFIVLDMLAVMLPLVQGAWRGVNQKAAGMQNQGLPTISFVAVQDEHGSLDHFMEMTGGVPDKPDLVLWPEEALPYDVSRSKRDWPRLLEFVKQKNCVLVLGTQETATAGKGWRNTALALDAKGELGRHYKMHPVHLFDDGIPGTEAKPVVTRLGKIGTPICFDCDYQDVVRTMTLKGAEWFAVPSMDPIAWGPVERQMHSVLFRIRAAENGRAMVVAATSGVTQVIDGWGHNVLLRKEDGTRVNDGVLPIIEPGVLTGRLPVRSGLTFFTLWGWMFPWLALGGGAVGIGVRERRGAGEARDCSQDPSDASFPVG